MLQISDKLLWEKILSHDLDKTDSQFTFSKRLARDNGWSHSFSLAVVKEYKKFIYLICVSQETLTPSDEVDQAWHLHLTYTRDYWDVFCKEMIGRKIHHGSTKGGRSEDKKYLECYENTKALYYKEFGVAPNSDVWPDSKTRFSNAGFLKRIDTSRYFLFPKQAVRSGLVLSGLVLLTGCTVIESLIPERFLEAFSILSNFLVTLLILGAVYFLTLAYESTLSPEQRKKRQKNKNNDDDGFELEDFFGSRSSKKKDYDSDNSGCSGDSSGCGGD